MTQPTQLGLEDARDDFDLEEICSRDFEISAQGEKYLVISNEHPSMAVTFPKSRIPHFFTGVRHRLTFHKKGVFTIEGITKQVKVSFIYKTHMRNIGVWSSKGTKPMLITHKSGLEAFYVPNIEMI